MPRVEEWSTESISNINFGGMVDAVVDMLVVKKVDMLVVKGVDMWLVKEVD